jgi:hypothetical protein
MAHFCKCGADEYICQECGRINCSKEQPSRWILVKRMDREGNVCPDCVQAEANKLHHQIMSAHKRGGGVGASMLSRYSELLSD